MTTTDSDRVRLEQLEAEVRELRARLDRLDANGMSLLQRAGAFAGSGGDYGTSERFARSDHAH